MFPLGLFGKTAPDYRHWNLVLILKLLKLGPYTNPSAPLPPRPQFSCTNSSFSFPSAWRPLAPLPAVDLQDCLLSCNLNCIYFQRGRQRKIRKELWEHISTATYRQTPSCPDVNQLRSRSCITILEQHAAQTNKMSHSASLISSRLMSSGTAPLWIYCFQIGVDSCPTSRTWSVCAYPKVSSKDRLPTDRPVQA